MHTKPIQNHGPLINLVAELAELLALNRRDGTVSGARVGPCHGDVCVARIPFSDGSGYRDRFAVLLSREGADFVVAPLSGHPPRWQFEVAVCRWREAGLPGPGTVRCSKIGSLCRSRVFRVVGRLAPEDRERVTKAMTEWFTSVVTRVSL